MGEASASFGDSQNFQEETSTSTNSSGPPPKRTNRRSKDVKQGQASSRKRNSSQKERTCVCDLCDFSTAYSFSLMRHKEKVHKQVGGDTKVKVKAEVKPATVPAPVPAPKEPTPEPVVLPSMFSSNRPDFLDLQNFSNPNSLHENAQWSIPNPPPASTSIKFETTEGIPINIFESTYTTLNPGEFITFRKADDSSNNVVETLMNGYPGSGFPPQLPGPIPANPSLPSFEESRVQVVAPEKQKSPIPIHVPHTPVKPEKKGTQSDAVAKVLKKVKAKKVTKQHNVSEGGESSKSISKKKSAKKNKPQVTSDDTADEEEADNIDTKRRRSQSKHVKIMITSTVSQCPLCTFASKYPSNTGRHFYGIHKDEYNKVVRGELQVEGIRYREEKVKKPKEVRKAPVGVKHMVELKIPQVTATLRHDFDNPPVLVPQSSIAPTAAQELEQFVQQENLEMFASGEPDNLDLSTEPMASFIESLLSSSIEPEWNLSHVESQYPQPPATFTPAMNNNFGHPSAVANVVPPAAPQVTSIPVNYMHPYHEIPQAPVMAHNPLQPIATVEVPVSNFNLAPTLKVQLNLPTPEQDNKSNQNSKTSLELAVPAVRPNTKTSMITDDEKEAKRKRALERKRELRKQKKLQKEADKFANNHTAPATGTLQAPGAPIVNQTDWSSQYFQIPDHEQNFPGPSAQNHPTQFESMKNEGLTASHVQASYLPMPLQSPGMKPQPEQYQVLDHTMVISQPAMSPAPPVLSMASQVSMNTSHNMGETVFYENHMQTLPTLDPEYPSPPQLQMPDYRSQMNISHAGDFLSPPKLTHSAGFPSPPGLSHTSQYSNLSSPVCVVPSMDYQSPSTSQGLSDSTDSTILTGLPAATPPDRVSQPSRRKKSELSQEEIDAAKQRHLARRREKYRYYQEAKKNKTFVSATKTQSSGLTPDEEAKRQKRLAKRRELDAARRKQKLGQVKSECGSESENASKGDVTGSYLKVGDISSRRTSTEISENLRNIKESAPGRGIIKMKKANPRSKKPLAKVTPSVDPGKSVSAEQNVREGEWKARLGEKKKSKPKRVRAEKPVDGASTSKNVTSELQAPSNFIATAACAKSDRTSAAKQQGLTPEELEEKKKEKKREQNRRYITKRRLMAKAASQIIQEKKSTSTSTSTSSTSISGVSPPNGQVQRGEDAENPAIAKNENEPTGPENGSAAAASCSNTVSPVDTYGSSPSILEPMKISEFQQQFLRPLPIQETQAIEAFGYRNVQAVPGSSLFSSQPWGSHVKSEKFPLENPDARLESFSNLNRPLNFDAVVQNPPSKKLKGKKVTLSAGEKETKKKVMLEKRKDQRRLKRDLKVKLEVPDDGLITNNDSSDTYFPPTNLVTKTHAHVTDGQDRKCSSQKSEKPKSSKNVKIAEKKKDNAGKQERKQLAMEKQREKQREKRRQVAELKRKEKDRLKGVANVSSEPTQQVAFLEVNKPAEIQHCSFQDCDFKTDSKYKLIVHTTFHDALTNMPPMVRSMLEATGNIDLLMKLQPERDPYNGCIIAKPEELAINRNDTVSTGAPG